VEVKVRIYELLGADLMEYNPTSPQEVNLMYEWVWSGTGDQDFNRQMGQLISNSYPRSQQAIFNDAHKRDKYNEYYLNFRKAFFVTGLNSSETQSYYRDARQVNGK
jgi:hypothetical protein